MLIVSRLLYFLVILHLFVACCTSAVRLTVPLPNAPHPVAALTCRVRATLPRSPRTKLLGFDFWERCWVHLVEKLQLIAGTTAYPS